MHGPGSTLGRWPEEDVLGLTYCSGQDPFQNLSDHVHTYIHTYVPVVRVLR
jgi:hypothetical protein